MLGQSDELPDKKKRLTSAALSQFEKAYELKGRKFDSMLVIELARSAYEANDISKAKTYAEILTKHTDSDSIHHGYIVLGRIALQAGDIQEAKNRLLAAGRISGSPPLDSFGPNMMLALELLQKGEKETVLDYFQLCRKFWSGEELDKWEKEVKAGLIPDFQANLIY